MVIFHCYVSSPEGSCLAIFTVMIARCFNMLAANPRFARGESRISFDMLKSLRKVYSKFFTFQNNKP